MAKHYTQVCAGELKVGDVYWVPFSRTYQVIEEIVVCRGGDIMVTSRIDEKATHRSVYPSDKPMTVEGKWLA